MEKDSSIKCEGVDLFENEEELELILEELQEKLGERGPNPEGQQRIDNRELTKAIAHINGKIDKQKVSTFQKSKIKPQTKRELSDLEKRSIQLCDDDEQFVPVELISKIYDIKQIPEFKQIIETSILNDRCVYGLNSSQGVHINIGVKFDESPSVTQKDREKWFEKFMHIWTQIQNTLFEETLPVFRQIICEHYCKKNPKTGGHNLQTLETQYVADEFGRSQALKRPGADFQRKYIRSATGTTRRSTDYSQILCYSSKKSIPWRL